MEKNNINSTEEINLFDYFNVLIKHRWMIIRNMVVVSIVILVISFFLPKSYTAKTTLLPPDEMQQSGVLSTLVGTPLSQLGLSQVTSTSDIFVQILKSRTVFDNVLKTRFEYKGDSAKTLISILEIKSLEKARGKLQQNVKISASPEGVVSVEVELFDPNLAADVANTFVAELDKVNKQKSTSRAKNSRIYIEYQLQETEKKLKEASDALAEFKQKYKAVSLKDQTTTAIEKAGEIKGNIIAKEVELGVALQTMKPDNVYIIQLRKEIEELRKQYNYLQFGNDESLVEQQEFYIPFKKIPEVGLELAKLIREVKVQETVWELLNQQYYHAKIQEAKDTPTVQVLDEAVPPEFRSKPKRKLLVLVGGFLTLLVCIFWAFTIEFTSKIKTEQNTINIVETLKADASTVKSFSKNKIDAILHRRNRG